MDFFGFMSNLIKSMNVQNKIRTSMGIFINLDLTSSELTSYKREYFLRPIDLFFLSEIRKYH